MESINKTKRVLSNNTPHLGELVGDLSDLEDDVLHVLEHASLVQALVLSHLHTFHNFH